MGIWQAATVLLSLWVLTAVGVHLARRNWNRLAHSSLVQSGGATLMADEWHLSGDAREAVWQAFWLIVGLILVGEGVAFSAVSVYTLLFG